jgi:hypothetical protein
MSRAQLSRTAHHSVHQILVGDGLEAEGIDKNQSAFRVLPHTRPGFAAFVFVSDCASSWKSTRVALWWSGSTTQRSAIARPDAYPTVLREATAPAAGGL